MKTTTLTGEEVMDIKASIIELAEKVKDLEKIIDVMLNGKKT